MKKFILVILICISTKYVNSQSTTKKWNSTYSQWEWYDDYNKLIQFEKYDQYCSCYKTYDAKVYYQNGQKRLYSDYELQDLNQSVNNSYNNQLNEYNTLLQNQRELKQKTDFIYNKLKNINSTLEYIATLRGYKNYDTYKDLLNNNASKYNMVIDGMTNSTIINQFQYILNELTIIENNFNQLQMLILKDGEK
jgi:hypothetical protein